MDPITLSAIIGAASSAIPFVSRLFGKKTPPDVWHEWTWDERKQYVKESLLLATSAVLSGKAISIDDVMKPLIARVDNEPYANWKRLNRYHITPMMNEADAELMQAKKMVRLGISFDNAYFKYISPEMIDVLKKDNATLSSVFSGSSWVVVFGLAVAGLFLKKSLGLQFS
jgi:hypothetical protein